MLRAAGPRGWPVIWHGLEYGPALVVLDVPNGGRWADLPRAWRDFAETHQVAWCRMEPGAETPHQVEDVMETLVDRNVRTHVVAAAPLAGVARRLAEEYDVVRDVVVCSRPVSSAEAVDVVRDALTSTVPAQRAS